ncbi:MAG: FG-GAP repeat protein, partial [Bradymonadaceae bacterium]|nr:FG-GAP repeat protein [Lujinxingiaceae bacterium]
MLLLVLAVGCSSEVKPPVSDQSPASQQGFDEDNHHTPQHAAPPNGKLERADWHRSFDRRNGYSSATVLALGNVKIADSGSLKIAPTPAFDSEGREVSPSWQYETHLASVWRGDNQFEFSDAAIERDIEGSRHTSRYTRGVEVLYDHVSNGLKQSIVLAEKPVGAGQLRIRFDVIGDISLEMVDDGERINVIHANEVIFAWTELFVHDSAHEPLAASMRVDGQSIVFDVDDARASYPITIDPLASDPSLGDISGDGSGARFGIRVSSAGDVNGDGFDDIIVGESRYSVGLDQRGRALIFLGSESGISSTAAWTTIGATFQELLGTALDTAGDLSGNGCDDILVGSPSWWGPSAASSDFARGRVQLFSFNECGLPGDTLTTVSVFEARGEIGGNNFGRAVANAGDFNCDGTPDILIGAFGHSAGAGKIYVYFGATGTNPFLNPPWTFSSPNTGAQLGWAVAGAGNVNGAMHDDNGTLRSCDDILVGGPAFNGNRGIVHLLLGANPTPSATSAWSISGVVAGDRLGSALSGGDVNGDGFNDIVIGVPRHANSLGRVKVYMGTDAVDGDGKPVFSEFRDIDGPAVESRFGTALSAKGDFNADGFADVVVGAPFFDTSKGRVDVYLGSPSGLTNEPIWTTISNVSNSEYGSSLAAAADVNRVAGEVSYSDLVVGAYADNNVGRIYVYPGQPNCYIEGENDEFAFYANGVVNPESECQICDVTSSRTQWSVRTNGTSCGGTCFDGQCNDDGLCEGGPVVCYDGCHFGDCGEATGCTFDPTNDPNECSAPPCTGNGDCSDGNVCTADICDLDTERCVFDPLPATASCTSDGVSCTVNHCDGAGSCVATVPTGCYINNACYIEGALNPDNSCQSCQAASDPRNWTNRSSGLSCDDGDYCTVNNQCDGNGTCSAGVARVCSVPECFASSVCNSVARSCQPQGILANATPCDESNNCTERTCQSGTCTGPNVDCNDGLACTTNNCTPATGCQPPVITDGCVIGNACYANGATNSANDCEECNTALSNTGWSAKSPTAACDDGNLCTVGSMCLNRVCLPGTLKDCSAAGDQCNTGTCNATDGSCAPQPANENGGCDDGNLCTVNNVCQGGSCSVGTLRDCSAG